MATKVYKVGPRGIIGGVRDNPLGPDDPEFFAKIASKAHKTVEEVEADFRTCHFYGELADRYHISFPDACYLMSKAHGQDMDEYRKRQQRLADSLKTQPLVN